MNSQQRSESRNSNITGSDQNQTIGSAEDTQTKYSEFRKPPLLNSPDLSDLITTPPLQNITTFTNEDRNQKSFEKVQNLPTPIITTRDDKLFSPISSPTSPSLRIPSNNAAFTMSKVRNKTNHILTESNCKVQNIIDGNSGIVSNSILVPKKRVNSTISSVMFMQNIRPVDRVVSLPLPPPNLNEPIEVKTPLTRIDNWDHISESPFALPTYFLTYSIDEQHRPQRWEVAYEIGSGSFSKVYLEKNGQVALKVTDVTFHEDGGDNSELKLRIQNSFTREIEILKSLRHPNIIRLIGTDRINNGKTEEPERIVMALEYCTGGNLFDFILKKHEEMSETLIQCIFANIVSAVYYLHTHNICHRDIKPENVLLKFTQLELLMNGVELSSKNFPLVVLSDFGLSKKIDNNNPLLSTRCGSEDYVSPELLLGMPYDGKQNDCWSLGVVLYTLLEARLPFDPLPTETTKLNSRKATPSHRIVMMMWSWYKVKDDKDGSFAEPKNIVKTLLCKRNKRANIQDIANTNWVKNIH